MRVKLDCEAKYAAERDPWGIGQADSARYDLYVDSIRAHARARRSLLDVGCGFGAMLARLRSDFERLNGIELSADAIAKGAARHPFIEFEQGSIDALERTAAHRDRFDAIVFSDVLYYVDEAGRRASLHWIAEHLERHGLAFIAAYSPGGKEYPTPDEVCALVARELVIERRELLDSEHLMLLARPRRRLAALTLDYETWQPVPAGRRIDWDADVFEPTDALLDACDAESARLTIFAELGEHAYLREHEPELAARMEAQWRDAVQRGHDVQMHLHPNWLPELGARFERGRYVWNELLTRAVDHPDLVGLIGRLKQTLHEAIRSVDPSYETVAFRAGGYEAQPFRPLAEALRANAMWCDSSVYHGGRLPGLFHDYSCPFDTHQPWFASHVDPQLQAPCAERGIVELPVATFARNDRWTFDTHEGARFGDRLLAAIEAERTAGPSIELARRLAKARKLGGAAYELARDRCRLVDSVLPRRFAHVLVDHPRGRVAEDDFYVGVGHSKADLDIPAIRGQLRVLREAGVEVVRLAEMAQLAREQLERHTLADAEASECDHAHRERAGVAGDARESPNACRLRAMIPLDRTRVLVIGRARAMPAGIASEHPWMQVTDVDLTGSALPFDDGAFDCVYTETALTRALDVDAVLSEAWRVLADGGLLLTALSPLACGARGGSCDHAWRPAVEAVRLRMGDAGFLDVSVEEADAHRLGASPGPPAAERMLYVRAWRRASSLAPVARVDELLRWAHERLDPSHPSKGVLADPPDCADADCDEAVLALAQALMREGYAPRHVRMLVRDHPLGHGARLQDTHDVIELTLADHSTHILDPIAGVRFPCPLQVLIDRPVLADGVERERDQVYVARRCDLYSTSFWYVRVVAVAVRAGACERPRFVSPRWAGHAAEPRYQALAFLRGHAWRAIRRLRSA